MEYDYHNDIKSILIFLLISSTFVSSRHGNIEYPFNFLTVESINLILTC
jgi:hypothetical protein